LTFDQIAELAETYRSGKTIKELASAFGVHRTTVAAHLEAQGINTLLRSLRQAGVSIRPPRGG
jgi:DNA-binding transcriptional ArsR family regulator